MGDTLQSMREPAEKKIKDEKENNEAARKNEGREQEANPHKMKEDNSYKYWMLLFIIISVIQALVIAYYAGNHGECQELNQEHHKLKTEYEVIKTKLKTAEEVLTNRNSQITAEQTTAQQLRTELKELNTEHTTLQINCKGKDVQLGFANISEELKKMSTALSANTQSNDEYKKLEKVLESMQGDLSHLTEKYNDWMVDQYYKSSSNSTQQ